MQPHAGTRDDLGSAPAGRAGAHDADEVLPSGTEQVASLATGGEGDGPAATGAARRHPGAHPGGRYATGRTGGSRGHWVGSGR